MNITGVSRRRFLTGTTIAAIAAGLATPALAQDDTGSGFTGLSEIIVTAQKREQSLQDVPIAVTAVTADALAANRITNVIDLSAIAPGNR